MKVFSPVDLGELKCAGSSFAPLYPQIQLLPYSVSWELILAHCLTMLPCHLVSSNVWPMEDANSNSECDLRQEPSLSLIWHSVSADIYTS